jgi:hypothetical protein
MMQLEIYGFMMVLFGIMLVQL